MENLRQFLNLKLYVSDLTWNPPRILFGLSFLCVVDSVSLDFSSPVRISQFL